MKEINRIWFQRCRLTLGGMALVIKEPYGVVVGMAPWNAALLLGLRAVCAPIACGNTAVYLPSSTVSFANPPSPFPFQPSSLKFQLESLRTLPRHPQLHRPHLPRRRFSPRRPQHNSTPSRRRPSRRRVAYRPPRNPQDKFHWLYTRGKHYCETCGTVSQAGALGVGREG